MERLEQAEMVREFGIGVNMPCSPVHHFEGIDFDSHDFEDVASIVMGLLRKSAHLQTECRIGLTSYESARDSFEAYIGEVRTYLRDWVSDRPTPERRKAGLHIEERLDDYLRQMGRL